MKSQESYTMGSHEDRVKQMARQLGADIQREQDRLLHSEDPDAVEWRRQSRVDERQAVAEQENEILTRVGDDQEVLVQAIRDRASFVEATAELGSKIEQTRKILERFVDLAKGLVGRTAPRKVPFYGRVSFAGLRRWTARPYASRSGVCSACAKLDGMVFSEEDAPPYPLHPNCCCILVPVGGEKSEPGEHDIVTSSHVLRKEGNTAIYVT
jgi:hypothetical protein